MVMVNDSDFLEAKKQVLDVSSLVFEAVVAMFHEFTLPYYPLLFGLSE